VIRRLLPFLMVFSLLGGALASSQTAHSQTTTFETYLPLVLNGIDPIRPYLDQVSLDKLTEYASDLVTLYGPRYPTYYRVYIDDQCTLGATQYKNNNLHRSSKYVEAEFSAMGYTVYREVVPNENGAFNVLAMKWGTDYPNIFIEVGAHIDSRAATPGASDNASGTSAVLELARVLKDYPSRYSLRFITFINEEYGLRGSRYHVEQVVNNGEQIKAALIMDGIGWSELAPQNMNCIWDAKDPETMRIAGLFDQARQRYAIDIGWRRCTTNHLQFSDNAVYWDEGLAAVLSIGGLPYTDPNYHKCGDSMNSIDMQNVYKTAQENLVVLLTLDAEQPGTPAPLQMELPWLVEPVEGH
jgi:hypothetical protein